jgi:hypothetical protein
MSHVRQPDDDRRTLGEPLLPFMARGNVDPVHPQQSLARGLDLVQHSLPFSFKNPPAVGQPSFARGRLPPVRRPGLTTVVTAGGTPQGHCRSSTGAVGAVFQLMACQSSLSSIRARGALTHTAFRPTAPTSVCRLHGGWGGIVQHAIARPESG